MTGQPEGQSKGIQRTGENPKRESKVDNRDQLVLKVMMSVRAGVELRFWLRQG